MHFGWLLPLPQNKIKSTQCPFETASIFSKTVLEENPSNRPTKSYVYANKNSPEIFNTSFANDLTEH